MNRGRVGGGVCIGVGAAPGASGSVGGGAVGGAVVGPGADNTFPCHLS